MKVLTIIVQLLTCSLLILAIAINKDKKVFGIALNKDAPTEETVNEWTTVDGMRVINTQHIAKDVWGFGGNVPINVYLRSNRIDHIELLPNSESPDYIATVTGSGLLSSWNGLTPQEVGSRQVDAVSGATLSSGAIIQSVRLAMAYAEGNEAPATNTGLNRKDIRLWCVLAVVASGLIVPLVHKSKRYRTAQLVLNLIVLGCWSGSFISLSLLVNFFANGVNVWVSLVPLLLLAAAFIYPLFGKNYHYCMWLCPMGSCQELIGKMVPYKIKISPKTVQRLNTFREMLWLTIMAVMWLGVGFELLNYELFSAFMFRQASIPIIVAALVFALLSGVIQRPYCRFVCPTGSLIKYAQLSKSKIQR